MWQNHALQLALLSHGNMLQGIVISVSQRSFPNEGPLKNVLNCYKHMHNCMAAKYIKVP